MLVERKESEQFIFDPTKQASNSGRHHNSNSATMKKGDVSSLIVKNNIWGKVNVQSCCVHLAGVIAHLSSLFLLLITPGRLAGWLAEETRNLAKELGLLMLRWARASGCLSLPRDWPDEMIRVGSKAKLGAESSDVNA